MKRLFVFLMFAIASISLVNYAAAQQCVNVKVSSGSCNGVKGKLPPRWLLNKVTPSQYDTLTILNRLCDVDYSMLKGYDVTPSDVAQVMTQARENINKALNNNNGITPRVGWKKALMITVSPWRDKVEKGQRKVEYMIYSSVDGYDVHLLLRATFKRDRQTGGYRSVAYDVVPYSVQGIPVKIGQTRVSTNGIDTVECLDIAKGGKSSCYVVNTAVNFTDPLGNKHFEQVDMSLWLTLNN